MYIIDLLPNYDNEFVDSNWFHIILIGSALYLAEHNISLAIAFLLFYLLVTETKYHKKWLKMFEKVPVDNVIKTKCKVREVEPSWTVPAIDNSIKTQQTMSAFAGKEWRTC